MYTSLYVLQYFMEAAAKSISGLCETNDISNS